ncbi:MAG: hypothetical protein J4F39_19065 [Candidatus Latescibacteria bacterium]|nr:hypothetical protein [Candidatus Latescibacterota bacterium]
MSLILISTVVFFAQFAHAQDYNRWRLPDGAVGFPDFLRFAAQFGQSRGDAGFDARFDLNGDGTVGFSDFVIFARSFGLGG